MAVVLAEGRITVSAQLGTQPIDPFITSVGPGRIARTRALQWLDRPMGMLSPSRLVPRTIHDRRSHEIIDQRFPGL